MMEVLQNHPLITALGWMLLHSLWQAALLALLARILWLFVSRKFAIWRYGLSLISLLLILVSAVITLLSYQDRYTDQQASSVALEAPVVSSNPEPYSSPPGPALSDIILMPESNTAGSREEPFRLDTYLPYLVLFWGLGAFFMSLRLAGSWWYMRRVSRTGLIAPDVFWEDRFQHLMQRMGLRSRVRIYFSSLTEEALTFGHLKPIILFPIGLVNQLSMEQVEAILLHELAHIRRWDYLVNWLQSVVELLFFFHPAVWWLSHEVRKAREHCCDDLVLRRGGTSRKLYAQTLTQLAALSFKSKPKLVMSIKGIKDAFSQRVLRLYGHNQAVLDWRKPVLSLALGCMLLPFLWLVQPEVFDRNSGLDKLSSFPLGSPEIELADGGDASEPFTSALEDLILPPVLYPTSSSELGISEDFLFEQFQLDPIADPALMMERQSTVTTIPNLPGLGRDRIEQYTDRQLFSEPKMLTIHQPLFIVDGKEIPADAPYRQISRDDIAKFTWMSVPWDPEQIKKLPPNKRNGAIKIETKAGNWPGGRPYWPIQIQDREIKYGDHLKSWFPLGKANSRKEIDIQEGMAFLPGWNRVVRRVNVNGKETYSIFNGRVLKKGETVETNQHTLFGNRKIPAIGLYDDQGQLIYGQSTPPEIATRTMVLNLKDGYRAIIGKYPCDNVIYLCSYTSLGQSPLNYNFYKQLNQGFEDVVARKALRYCERQEKEVGTIDKEEAVHQPLVPEPLFVIDGQVIYQTEPYREISNDRLKTQEFILPEDALIRYGEKGENGVVILKSKAGAAPWKGGKPYSPMYKLLGGKSKEEAIERFADSDLYFINGQRVNLEQFNSYNSYSFIRGTIMHPKVGAIYGLDGSPVSLTDIQRIVGQDGIAYEIGHGVIVVEYLERCKNTIPIVAVFSPLTNRFAREKHRLREAISWRENEIDCAENSIEQVEMADENMAYISLLQKIKPTIKVYPSPFTEEVRIAFSLPETMETKISILNPEGKLIKELVHKKLEAGPQEFIWNPRDQSAGNYWVRIEAGAVGFTRPLIRL